MSNGSLGAGEAYMDGWWDCARLDMLFDRILRSGVDRAVQSIGDLQLILSARLQNMQTPARADAVAHTHYNLSPELYRAMLDTRMIYSCGYWPEASDLDQAQEAKLHLICRKLELQPGMTLLDIGCGWGGAAKFAAENYGVSVTGITVSSEQARIAVNTCRGLPIEILVSDYRSLTGQFDRIMSIGMFEHVGYKNYRTYFRIARELLNPEGLFLLHTIGSNTSNLSTDTWIEKYIFPNSMLPSPAQVTKAIESFFVIEDWHNFGADYDRTLMCWHNNITGAWQDLSANYDERFQRMWQYYLMSSAGSFRSRTNQLWQILLSPSGLPGGWTSVR
jgi:cyclopropane-fatty-acyl-phospholipid synthase